MQPNTSISRLIGDSLSLIGSCMEDIQAIKKSVHRLWNEFLYNQEDRAQSQQAKRAIKMTRCHEESRRSWRSINYSHGKTRSKSISAVEVLNDGERKIISYREPAEAAIMANNSEYFHLTKSTPLISKYMREK